MKDLSKSSSYFRKTLALGLMGLFSQALQAESRYDFSHERTRCSRADRPFVLNQSNVAAFVALSCSALSHVENERSSMNYEGSATLFHSWKIEKKTDGYHVLGFCAIPLPDLEKLNLKRHRINLSFQNHEAKSRMKKTLVKGEIVGKSVSLEFSENKFWDSECSSEERQTSQLQAINLGAKMGPQALYDILKSRRTSVRLQLLGRESWIQETIDHHSASGVGVIYRIPQFGGRQLGLALTTGDSIGSLFARSGALLEYYEGSSYFTLRNDTFDVPTGFLEPSLPTNHKFSRTVLRGSSWSGCSSLVYESELSRSTNVNLNKCQQKIKKSGLAEAVEKLE